MRPPDDDQIVLGIIRRVCASRATLVKGEAVCFLSNLRFQALDAGVEEPDGPAERLFEAGLIRLGWAGFEHYAVALTMLEIIAEAARDT